MPDITVTVTDTQYKGLEYVAADPQEWAENALLNRARISNEDIIAKLVTHCNENGIALAVGHDAQIQQAFDLEVVKTVAQRNEEALANLGVSETP